MSEHPRPTVRELIELRRDADSRAGARSDPYRLALVIEGGGMRGVISAGMTLAVADAGALDCIDDVYGSSAGSINAAWLLSPTPHQLTNWADPSWAERLIRGRNVLRLRPVIDVAGLIDHVYVDEVPLDYQAVLDNEIQIHPMATSCATGLPEDLHPLLVDVPALRQELKASAALPLLAGRPVSLAGGSYTDAGVADPVPVLEAVTQGATHVLVLRSRRLDDRRSPDPTGARRALVTRALIATGHGAPVAHAVASRSTRDAAFDRVLAGGWNDVTEVLTVWPDESTPTVPRLERRGEPLGAAFEAGREQVRRLLAAAG